MLLVHEVHRVAGKKEEAFEAAFRDELLPALASADDSRLLWFLRVAHGSGPAYTVVTVTGCRDAAAWATLAERLRGGDLADWSAKDGRHAARLRGEDRDPGAVVAPPGDRPGGGADQRG